MADNEEMATEESAPAAAAVAPSLPLCELEAALGVDVQGMTKQACDRLKMRLGVVMDEFDRHIGKYVKSMPPEELKKRCAAIRAFLQDHLDASLTLFKKHLFEHILQYPLHLPAAMQKHDARPGVHGDHDPPPTLVYRPGIADEGHHHHHHQQLQEGNGNGNGENGSGSRSGRTSGSQSVGARLIVALDKEVVAMVERDGFDEVTKTVKKQVKQEMDTHNKLSSELRRKECALAAYKATDSSRKDMLEQLNSITEYLQTHDMGDGGGDGDGGGGGEGAMPMALLQQLQKATEKIGEELRLIRAGQADQELFNQQLDATQAALGSESNVLRSLVQQLQLDLDTDTEGERDDMHVAEGEGMGGSDTPPPAVPAAAAAAAAAAGEERVSPNKYGKRLTEPPDQNQQQGGQDECGEGDPKSARKTVPAMQ
ncbi:unnamed protein product [Vitrella brassicaformis CCMP3155]|uniref:Uncharacterized protein n=3 Tax=Vitrella brassicaformis TaxID=1169539 RepID=A0A0G4GJT6_VITBC|nr:unnamed protein product [Vitrella brassicaformis CCMP3155]|eukprot:CEM30161.1 unnamed protein product [Vitrella brassicaformis CCMP3155]